MLSKLLHLVGLGGSFPKSTGTLPVSSAHERIPNGPLVQVFFPFVEEDDTARALGPERYVYRSDAIVGIANFSRSPLFLLNLFLAAFRHPLPRPPLALPARLAREKFPLVVFSHGLGGSSEVYTKTCTDLSSHGFVVVCIEHEDGSGSFATREDGTPVAYIRPPIVEYTRENVVNFRAPFLKKRGEEIEAVLNFVTNPPPTTTSLLARCVDSNRMHLAGHSFGACGIVAYQATRQRADVRSLILLDIWSFPLPDAVLDSSLGRETRVLSILSEPFTKSSEVRYTKRLLRSNAPRVSAYFIPKSVHSSFSDTQFWTHELFGFLARKFDLRGELDPAVLQAAFIEATVHFLARETQDYEHVRPFDYDN